MEKKKHLEATRLDICESGDFFFLSLELENYPHASLHMVWALASRQAASTVNARPNQAHPKRKRPLFLLHIHKNLSVKENTIGQAACLAREL